MFRFSVVFLTIIGWCTFQWTESVTGNLGIISVFPIVAFYASGILVKSDYENMSWAVRRWKKVGGFFIVFFFSLRFKVLTLIGGGVAIGVAATASNLLDILSNGLADLVGESGPWVR